MTTARDLIEDAAAEIGELAADTSLSDTDAQRMLRRLQRMLDSWSVEGLMVYELHDESLALSGGVASYSTSGFSGRPTRIDGVTVRLSGVDYPIQMISKQNYDAIGVKTAGGIPDRCYVQMGMPNATLYFFPVPSSAMTASVTVWRRLPTGLALSTTVSLPPGYEEAITTNLAVACAPLFGREPSAATVDAARRTKAVVKRANVTFQDMDIDLPGHGSRHHYVDMGVPY